MKMPASPKAEGNDLEVRPRKGTRFVDHKKVEPTMLDSSRIS
jgi:hypothetical protein